MINNVSDQEILIWLGANKQIHGGQLERIYQFYSTLQEAWEDNFALLQSRTFRKFDHTQYDVSEFVVALTVECAQQNIGMLLSDAAGYPSSLRELHDYPLILFYKGDFEVYYGTKYWIAVVGSRNVTQYGKEVIDRTLKPILSSQLGSISGLAYGIDGIVHSISLEQSAPTIAVVANGLNESVMYPKQHKHLAHQILAAGGVIVSEYPPYAESMPYMFRDRNRIIAALGQATYVVEAGEKSGSLITAQRAQELDRPLFTACAPINQKAYQGNLNLIRQGAIVVTSQHEIQSHFHLDTQEITNFSTNKTRDDPILTLLSQKALNVDDLAKALNAAPTEILTQLSILELQGEVRHLGANIWQAVFNNQ